MAVIARVLVLLSVTAQALCQDLFRTELFPEQLQQQQVQLLQQQLQAQIQALQGHLQIARSPQEQVRHYLFSIFENWILRRKFKQKTDR